MQVYFMENWFTIACLPTEMFICTGTVGAIVENLSIRPNNCEAKQQLSFKTDDFRNYCHSPCGIPVWNSPWWCYVLLEKDKSYLRSVMTLLPYYRDKTRFCLVTTATYGRHGSNAVLTLLLVHKLPAYAARISIFRNHLFPHSEHHMHSLSFGSMHRAGIKVVPQRRVPA